MLHILRDSPRASSISESINRPNWTNTQALQKWLEKNLAIREPRHGKISLMSCFHLQYGKFGKEETIGFSKKKKNENLDSFIENSTWFAQEWYFT